MLALLVPTNFDISSMLENVSVKIFRPHFVRTPFKSLKLKYIENWRIFTEEEWLFFPIWGTYFWHRVWYRMQVPDVKNQTHRLQLWSL